MQFQFDNFAQFIQMNGHGSFVWISYGITFLCVVAVIVYSRAQRKNLLKQIQNQQLRQNLRERQK